MLLREGADPEVNPFSFSVTKLIWIKMGYKQFASLQQAWQFTPSPLHQGLIALNLKVETTEGHTALLRAVKGRLLPMVSSYVHDILQ